ncbi:TPA: TetR/AcrR family transcriptional regulator, partial [Streptococcus pyogenes]
NLRCKYIDKTTIPEVFLKQFVLSSFIETLKWWLHQRQRMSANELLKYYLELIR